MGKWLQNLAKRDLFQVGVSRAIQLSGYFWRQAVSSYKNTFAAYLCLNSECSLIFYRAFTQSTALNYVFLSDWTVFLGTCFEAFVLLISHKLLNSKTAGLNPWNYDSNSIRSVS